MSTNLVILGRPPGRALFKFKSRTCFFIKSKMQKLTSFPNHDKNQYERNLIGILTYLLTLGVCIAEQQNSSEWSSSVLSQSFSYQDIRGCCCQCSSDIERHRLSIILFDLHLKLLATKNTQKKTISENMFLLLLKGKVSK